MITPFLDLLRCLFLKILYHSNSGSRSLGLSLIFACAFLVFPVLSVWFQDVLYATTKYEPAQSTAREVLESPGKTSGYYDNELPTVSGAIVTDTTSSSAFVFSEVPETGQYVCTDFESVIGKTYTLTTGYNGQTHTASETLISTPDLEDQIDQINDGGFGGDEIEVKFYFQDDGSHDNFNMRTVQPPFAKLAFYTVDSDERTQGNRTNLVFGHEGTAQGDVLAIRLSGISERYFNYMTRLLEPTGTGGGPLSTSSAAVNGNIVNQTNKATYVLGYFSLSEVVTTSYTVQ